MVIPNIKIGKKNFLFINFLIGIWIKLLNPVSFLNKRFIKGEIAIERDKEIKKLMVPKIRLSNT